MTQKLIKLGIKRQKGYLYYVDKRGDVSCAKMVLKGRSISPVKVAKIGLKRKEGYLYFVDKGGDVSVAKMSKIARKIKRFR